MKKLLIILTFLFSTLFFINNVNAETINFDFETKNYNYIASGYCDTEKVQNIYDTYYSNDYKYFLYGKQISGYLVQGILLWNDDAIDFGFDTRYYENNPAIRFYVINQNRSQFNLVQLNCNNATGTPTIGNTYTLTDTAIQYVNFWKKPSNFSSSFTLEDLNSNYDIDFSYLSNVPIKYFDYATYYPIFDGIQQAYQPFTYKGIDYEPGQFVFNSDFTQYEQKPSIDITKENETTVTIENETYITSVTLNIKFSSINNDKYLYQYKIIGDEESLWTTKIMENDNFSLKFEENASLIVRVVDKETNENVTSANYTVASINYTFEPFVEVVEETPSACYFYKNGTLYTICRNLNITARNLQDGNFIASYSYNQTDWFDFQKTTLSINENKTVYFRIINYLTDEISYTSSHTVYTIDNYSDLGVFNTYSTYYDKDTSFITAYINIYNLLEPVQDNYRIYYSTNSTSFIEITNLLTDMNDFYQYEINNINENKIIYFKITDLNSNILYTSSFSIHYQIDANENTNFFTSFRSNFHGLSDIIATPLSAIKKLNKGICSPLEIPIPYTNTSISLPCMTTIYENNIPDILNIWQIVTNGIISYYIILDLFRIVKSFKDPEEDKIEVVDL